MKRSIKKIVRGQKTIDGAGVRLVRVLGNATVEDFDPFLMLDSFDSLNPDDYTAGFPMHPHRGIETITYLVEGEIDHEDSLGNKGKIRSGEIQWMTAGSGIMHQEMPQPAERMLGLQLWLNLPKEEKMAEPKYFDIREDLVDETEDGGAKIRVISGEYKDKAKGAKPHHLQATIYDVFLPADSSLLLPTPEGENAFVFLIEGDAEIDGRRIEEKSAVLLDEGDEVQLASTDRPARIIFCSGKRLNEPISWGGPIVMNTREELQHAFDELREGTFIKHAPANA